MKTGLRWNSRFLWILLLGTLLGAGFWIRGLPANTIFQSPAAWWRTTSATVNLYFSDGMFLVPVSRRMPVADGQLRPVLQALLAGPGETNGLVSAIPRGVEIRSVKLSAGVAEIDLSAAFLGAKDEASAAQLAIVETMTALPNVQSVALSVEGKSLGPPARRMSLLYYASANGLIAVPVAATTPRDMITSYLTDPPAPRFTGLPADVQLLRYDYNPARHLVSLNFTYKPSVHLLALEKPDRMRFVLLGLIASLTEFPQVETVRLDFEGRTRLGVGQCSDLLRTPQSRPELLNDERLLGR